MSGRPAIVPICLRGTKISFRDGNSLDEPFYLFLSPPFPKSFGLETEGLCQIILPPVVSCPILPGCVKRKSTRLPIIESLERVLPALKASAARGREAGEGKSNGQRSKAKGTEEVGWKFQRMKLIPATRENRRIEPPSIFLFPSFFRDIVGDQMQFLLKLLLPFHCPLGLGGVH